MKNVIDLHYVYVYVHIDTNNDGRELRLEYVKLYYRKYIKHFRSVFYHHYSFLNERCFWSQNEKKIFWYFQCTPVIYEWTGMRNSRCVGISNDRCTLYIIYYRGKVNVGCSTLSTWGVVLSQRGVWYSLNVMCLYVQNFIQSTLSPVLDILSSTLVLPSTSTLNVPTCRGV